MNAFNVFLTLQTALLNNVMKYLHCFGHRSNTPRHDNSFLQNSEILRFVAKGKPWQNGIFIVTRSTRKTTFHPHSCQNISNSHLSTQKWYFVSKIVFHVFEIQYRTIYSNSERSEQFLNQNIKNLQEQVRLYYCIFPWMTLQLSRKNDNKNQGVLHEMIGCLVTNSLNQYKFQTGVL